MKDHTIPRSPQPILYGFVLIAPSAILLTSLRRLVQAKHFSPRIRGPNTTRTSAIGPSPPNRPNSP